MGLVANFKYKPTSEDLEWYRHACQYTYMMLTKKVKTIEGKTILRERRGDQDGRIALFYLWQDGKSSTAAQLRSEDILQEIINYRVEPGTTKSYLKSIDDLIAKMQDYNERQTDNSMVLTPTMQRVHLERAVEPVKGLREIKDRERQDVANGRAPLTSSGYISLLKNQASMMDKVRAKSRRTPSRSVNVANGYRSINVADGYYGNDNDEGNGNDSNTSDDFDTMIEYQVFKAMQKMAPGVRMDGESFKELSVEAKKAWSRLSSKDKTVILKASKDDTSTMKVNVAESSVVDGEQESEGGEPEDRTEVNMAQSDAKSKAHPGNINRMLSSSANGKSKDKDKDKKKSSTSTSRSVNTVKFQVSNVNWSTPDEDSDDSDGDEPPDLIDRPHYDSSSSEEEDSDDDEPPGLDNRPLYDSSDEEPTVTDDSDQEDDSLPDLAEHPTEWDRNSDTEDDDGSANQWKAYTTRFYDPWEDIDYADNEHEEADFGWGG